MYMYSAYFVNRGYANLQKTAWMWITTSKTLIFDKSCQNFSTEEVNEPIRPYQIQHLNEEHKWNRLELRQRRENLDRLHMVYVACGEGSINTLGGIVIPCLLSVCFDDAMHGIYASYFVNANTLQNMKHMYHALHHQNKPTKSMGWP